MGDINSKDYIDFLQNPSIIQNQCEDQSGKNNIILMNPELHIHSSDDRIKTLQEEKNKIKQDQFDVERKMRELEERQRQAEKSINEKMVRETDNQLKDQNEMLKWHIGILTEKETLLKEALEKEETIRKQSLLIKRQNDFISKFGSVQQTYKRQLRKRKKNHGGFNKWEHNRSCNANEMRRTHSHRNRSKSEDNRINDPMEFWEWNGTEWIYTKANHFGHMKKVQNKNTDVQSPTDDHLTSTVCRSTNNDAILTSPKQIENPSYISIHDATSVETSTSIYRDVTSNPVESIEIAGEQQIGNEIIIPMRYTDDRDRINFSVSFDEHELKSYKHDEDLPPRAKRPRSSK